MEQAEPVKGSRTLKRERAVRMLDDEDVARLLADLEDEEDDDEGEDDDADRRD